MEERRELERFPLDLAAGIVPAKGTRGEKNGIQSARTRDISSAGAFFYSPVSYPVGTEVEVEVFLEFRTTIEPLEKRRTRIHIKGIVLRKEPKGMAVKFGGSYEIRPWPNTKL